MGIKVLITYSLFVLAPVMYFVSFSLLIPSVVTLLVAFILLDKIRKETPEKAGRLKWAGIVSLVVLILIFLLRIFAAFIFLAGIRL